MAERLPIIKLQPQRVLEQAKCAPGDLAKVVLDGRSSADPDHTILSYRWTQVGGSSVVLSSSTSAVDTLYGTFAIAAANPDDLGRAYTGLASCTTSTAISPASICFWSAASAA